MYGNIWYGGVLLLSSIIFVNVWQCMVWWYVVTIKIRKWLIPLSQWNQRVYIFVIFPLTQWNDHIN